MIYSALKCHILIKMYMYKCISTLKFSFTVYTFMDWVIKNKTLYVLKATCAVSQTAIWEIYLNENNTQY